MSQLKTKAPLKRGELILGVESPLCEQVAKSYPRHSHLWHERVFGSSALR